MTFQPPPPPPPPSGYPPPGGQQPRPNFDPKTVNPLDWGILAVGLLAFIFSFISYYVGKVSTSGSCFGFSGESAGSESAWHGFFGWFAVLCAVAGAAVVAIELFVPGVSLGIANRLLGLGLFAVATLSVILALFIHPGTGERYHESIAGCTIDAHVGHGAGYWLSLIVIIAGLVLSLMRLQQTGGQLPGALNNLPNIGAYGPGGQSPQAPPMTPPPGGPPTAPPTAPPPQ